MEDSRFHEKVKGILQDLYGAEKAQPILGEFTALLKRRCGEQLSGRDRTERLSGRDVILITYPDQIHTDGLSPLSVLAEFCEKHLQGLIRYLHILPFYPSSSDDGFAVTDYHAVDPDLGSWDDIARLSGKFRLMVDAVLNHASAQSAWFQAFLRGEEAYRAFFIERPDSPGLSKVVRPRTSPLFHRYGTPPQEKVIWTTFSEDQVDLNYRNPRVLLEMADLLWFYAAHGASIIRLDAVAYLWKEVGTTCISLPQTHRIVQFLHAFLEKAAPGVFLATETNVPHAENISYAGPSGNEAHLIYNFSLPPLVLHTFLTGDSRVLSQWVGGLSPFGKETTFLNFLASHDGIGLNAAREILPDADLQRLIQTTLDRGGSISYKEMPDGVKQPYELNINYFDALSGPFGDGSLDLQIRRFLCAHAILLSLSGVPGIYFHSMFGSRGWRDGIRLTGRKRSINRQKLERAVLEQALAERTGIRSQVFSGMSAMIRARMNFPAFHPHGLQQVVDCGSAVFALLRTHAPTGERVLCLQEVTGKPHSISLDVESTLGSPSPRRTLTDGINGERIFLDDTNSIHLDPYQARWLTFHDDNPPPA